MNVILYELVIPFLIIGCCSQSLFPIGDDCSRQYDDRCIHTVYCKNSLNLRSDCSRDDKCRNVVYDPRHGTCDPLNVIYKYTEYSTNPDSFSRLRPSSAFITSLDLSDSYIPFFPKFEYMPNLAILKFSRCELNTAKLSNEEDLPALIDVDYSQNNIDNIEVIPTEHEYKTLKKLNISYNILDNIPEGIFDSFPNIENLDLSHNFLHVLDITYFEGMRLLYLDLSHNRIIDLDSSLTRLRNLLTLNLGHNNIKILKASDFRKLVNLQNIKLNSNEITTIEKNVFENMAFLTSIDLRDNILENIDQEIFANSSKLSTVYFSGNKLKALPKNMFKDKIIFDFNIDANELEGSLKKGYFEGLTKVTELDLSGQHLTSVENFAFAGLQNLKTLLLNNNNLEYLSNYSFKGLQNLNCLDLSNNNIVELDIVTEDLISLQILSLHHNKISHISSNNFVALGSLQFLDLYHNNISHLGSNSFRTLQSLSSFKISDNPLSGSLKEETFVGLSSLPSLDISGTLINTINNGSFMGMTILRDLNVSHSNITELQYNALSYMNNIETIDLSYNKLSTFAVKTTNLGHLLSLLLSNNMLKVVSHTQFNGMTMLTKIDLSRNQIRTVHKEAFNGLENILYLDLSYNQELKFDVCLVENFRNLDKLLISGTKVEVTFDNVINIPLTLLEIAGSAIKNVSHLKLGKLKRLEILVLNNNDVSRLEVGSLYNLTALRQLDLSYNDLSYIQPGVFKDTTFLNLLNISHNKLIEISYGIFRGLEYLKVIDLSYNKIQNLHRSRFYDVEQLATLLVDHNDINFIAEDEFLGTKLSKLSIGGNPLPCEIVAKIKRNKYGLSVTAINIDEINENVHGVTCVKNNYDFHTDLSPETANHDKLLLDIRNILYNVSKGQVVKEQVFKHNEPSYILNLTEQQQKLNDNTILMSTSIRNLSSVIKGNTNLLLGKILQVLTSKSISTSKPIVVTKENATSDNLMPYINKVKQELEDSIIIEKQNILELDNKIERLNSRIDSSVLTTKTPVREKLIGKTENMQKSSVFTEVCVGLMLVIMVGFILYKVYKSKLYIPSGRSQTSSIRNIAESMENSQL